MKRGEGIFLILFLSIVILNINFSTPASITGEVITGDAIQGIEMNITIQAPPVITILSPKNNTYITNSSILLDYTADPSAMTTWYNLDNLANTTVTGSLYFGTSIGSHILYLFSNNTYGESSKNVSFFINLSKLTILYSEYNSSLRGSSTEFINYTYEDLQNLGSIVLENAENGKIQFNININITDDEDFSDNLVNLDTHTNISFNRIEINQTALPNFNKTATLYLYNLTFTDPRVLRDGVVCPASTCVEESYTSATGIFVFNVTNFSIYSAEETPAGAQESPSGGASQGGRVTTSPKEQPLRFEVDRDLIKVQLKTEEKLSMSLKISNKYSTPLNFNISTNLGEILSFSETSFSIESEESKEIILSLDAKPEIKPGVHTGKIIVTSGKETKEIPVIVEIKTKKVIFDVSLDISSNHKEIFAGEDLIIQVTIFNLGDVEEADVILNYFIKDFEGNIIFSQQETVRVRNQASFSRTIKIPKTIDSKDYIILNGKFVYNGPGRVKFWEGLLTSKVTDVPNTISLGDYVIGVQVMYEDSVGTSSNIFRIKLKESFFDKYAYYLIFILIIGIMAIAIVIIFKKESNKLKILMYPQHPKKTKETIITHDKTFRRREKEERKIDSTYKKRIIKKTKEIKQSQKIERNKKILSKNYGDIPQK